MLIKRYDNDSVFYAEYFHFLSDLLKLPKELQKLETEWNAVAAKLFYSKDIPDANEISDKVRKFYFGDLKATDPKALDRIARLYSDSLLYLGFAESVQAQLKASNAPIYAYYFTYQKKYGLANFQEEMFGGIPRIVDFGIGAAKTWFRHKTNPDSIKKYGEEINSNRPPGSKLSFVFLTQRGVSC